MCGVVGAVTQGAVRQELFDALTLLQHRGQDAAGIMTSDNGRIFMRKSKGLVRDAIRESHMARLAGHFGIGHVRYPTAGSDSASESQPFYVNAPYGLGLVHNGNLVNVRELASELEQDQKRHLNTNSDSEVLLNILADALQSSPEKLSPEVIFQAVSRVCARLEGAYSVMVLINGYGVLAFRDPHGIRPLVLGRRRCGEGWDHMVASESVALNVLGYERVGDVAPGEAVLLTKDGRCIRYQCVASTLQTPCLFEYIYLARADSVIDGISVYRARIAMGKELAKKIKRTIPEMDIDVVIPVPDTSRSSALSLSQDLGVKYSEGFMKNRYIGRTFIMPGQAIRKRAVRMKLNTITEEFKDKVVLLVDDSIVRGTTSREIVQMARDAGARRVYFASAAPPVMFPNVYGIDMPTVKDLIAAHQSVESVCRQIGADWLVYQDLEAVTRATLSGALSDSSVSQFEESIFTGQYLTGHIDEAYLSYVEMLRDEATRRQKTRLSGDDRLGDT